MRPFAGGRKGADSKDWQRPGTEALLARRAPTKQARGSGNAEGTARQWLRGVRGREGHSLAAHSFIPLMARRGQQRRGWHFLRLFGGKATAAFFALPVGGTTTTGIGPICVPPLEVPRRKGPGKEWRRKGGLEGNALWPWNGLLAPCGWSSRRRRNGRLCVCLAWSSAKVQCPGRRPHRLRASSIGSGLQHRSFPHFPLSGRQ